MHDEVRVVEMGREGGGDGDGYGVCVFVCAFVCPFACVCVMSTGTDEGEVEAGRVRLGE